MAIDRHDHLRDRRALLNVYRRHYLSEDVPGRLWGVGSESWRLWIAVQPAIRAEAQPPGRRNWRDTRTGKPGPYSEILQGAPRGTALARSV